MENKELFRSHLLNGLGLSKCRVIGDGFLNLLQTVEIAAGKDASYGRYMAICRSKMEEACFYAKKAIACNPMNQTKQAFEPTYEPTEDGGSIKPVYKGKDSAHDQDVPPCYGTGKNIPKYMKCRTCCLQDACAREMDKA